MKRIVFLLILWQTSAAAQELVPGDRMPDLVLPKSISGGKQKTVSSFKGKILILDFWATWCSPCIAAMKDLEDYKKELGSQLEVIAVSDETEERLKKFNKVRPSTLTLASDTAGSLNNYFPHRTIPHTVLIGPDGKVYAITNASNITLDVLKLALKNVAIQLPVKKDNMGFDINTYFKADSSIARNFNLLPSVDGAGSMSKRYVDGPFKGRRYTIVNMPIDGLFREAYQKSYVSVINEYDTVKRAYADMEKFCLDAWIETADKNQLMAYIREELKKHFIDVEAVLEKRMRPVLLIKAKPEAEKLLKKSTEQSDFFNAGGGHFEGNGVKAAAIADYMENFGLYNGRVLDETGLKGNYDIFLQWQPEKKDGFKNALESLGLYWEKAEREVEMLVLKKR
ncbi:MAG: hypothetical protein DI535_04650 [Citrobacter freundii]|nr:MAG: hypothetical protein DI535_04650 [Citrobacter freundii]